jgi:hypothetical protein
MPKLLQALTLIRHVLVIGLLCALGYGSWLAFPALKGLPELVLHTNAFLDEATLTAKNLRETSQIVQANSQQEATAILQLTEQGQKTLAGIDRLATNTNLAVNQQLVPQVISDLAQTQLEVANSLGGVDFQVTALGKGIENFSQAIGNIRTLTADPNLPLTVLAIKNSADSVESSALDVRQAADLGLQKLRDELKPLPFGDKLFDVLLRVAEPLYYTKGLF